MGIRKISAKASARSRCRQESRWTTARSVSSNASIDGLVNGSLFELPAGRVS